MAKCTFSYQILRYLAHHIVTTSAHLDARLNHVCARSALLIPSSGTNHHFPLYSVPNAQFTSGLIVVLRITLLLTLTLVLIMFAPGLPASTPPAVAPALLLLELLLLLLLLLERQRRYSPPLTRRQTINSKTKYTNTQIQSC